MCSQIIAQVNNLQYAYGDIQAIDNISIELMSGEILAILGPNGAGKTTLINTLLGRKKNYHGHVTVFGETPGALVAKRKTGAMLQVSGLPDMIKVSEHIELFQSYYPSPMATSKVIDIAGLHEIMNSRSSELSGGQRQRLLFALSICGNPELLMLDEPTVGMDIMSRRALWQAIQNIRDEGVCVVLTTHYLDEADKLADRIIMLNKGKVIREGTPTEIKRNMAHQTIKFSADVAKEKIRDLAGVVAVAVEQGIYQIASKDAAATITDAFSNGIKIKELTVTNATLEEAFIRLSETQSSLESSAVSEEVSNEH